MRHDATNELFGYWNRLRGARAAPERREVTPAPIRSHLANTFILQATGTSEPRFRLAGTRLCSVYGRELKNLPFASLWQTRDKNTISRLLKNSMTNKCVVKLNYEGRSSRGRKALLNLLLLPLASEANEQYLLGMIIPLGQPFWLESDAIVENRIQSVSIIDPENPVPATDPIHIASEASVGVPLTASRTIVSRKVRHLRVFDGGKIID
ncbi:PAS domain-containing protein [Phyllobacterium lublinensis]|uniref:PAS domain-containing protein n=1 Tax=Phyllobacterium lublinensis TaxID=2875708 RepID=UPI001CC9417D|nr:PAS domain-containing protein [Phyllobacterium sp. 2063]MBZ9655664.1 PAS domain-containing protein [Phyllobacterium sp. 2063]